MIHTQILCFLETDKSLEIHSTVGIFVQMYRIHLWWAILCLCTAT